MSGFFGSYESCIKELDKLRLEYVHAGEWGGAAVLSVAMNRLEKAREVERKKFEEEHELAGMDNLAAPEWKGEKPY